MGVGTQDEGPIPSLHATRHARRTVSVGSSSVADKPFTHVDDGRLCSVLHDSRNVTGPAPGDGHAGLYVVLALIDRVANAAASDEAGRAACCCSDAQPREAAYGGEEWYREPK